MLNCVGDKKGDCQNNLKLKVFLKDEIFVSDFHRKSVFLVHSTSDSEFFHVFKSLFYLKPSFFSQIIKKNLLNSSFVANKRHNYLKKYFKKRQQSQPLKKTRNPNPKSLKSVASFSLIFDRTIQSHIK